MIDNPQTLLPRVMDLLLDPVCVVDEQGRYVFVSAAIERLLGYTREELIGRNMIELVHPDDRERTLAVAGEIMSGDPKLHFENRYVRKDGRVVHIMWSARWSESDRLRLAVARDVTELKHAQRMQDALYRISEAAHSADGLPALYRDIHGIIADLLPAANFCVALYDADDDSLSFPYFVDEREAQPGLQPLDAHAGFAEVMREGQSLLLSGNGDYQDWLGAPLMGRDGVMGALVLKTYAGEVRYAEEDRELLQFVSTQVAAAIERKQTEARLHRLAHYDALTDIPNRALFNDRFSMALKRAHRERERLALLYLDLDDFKDINDTCGHEAGDRLLHEVARRLVECVRDSDTVGRMGGDEFTVLLTNVHGPEDAAVIVEKIRVALQRPFQLGGRGVIVTVSIGTAVYPEQGEDMEELLRCADAGMYAWKRGQPVMEEAGPVE